MSLRRSSYEMPASQSASYAMLHYHHPAAEISNVLSLAMHKNKNIIIFSAALNRASDVTVSASSFAASSANLLPVVVAKKARESLKNLSRLFM
jgi:hypothetical protein